MAEKVTMGESFGPWLYFRGADAQSWYCQALVITSNNQKPAPFYVDGKLVEAENIHAFDEKIAWRFDLKLARGPDHRKFVVAILGQSLSVDVPGIGHRLDLVFTACNGQARENPREPEANRNRLWYRLLNGLSARPQHLLIQGGDQLYADVVWDQFPEMDWDDPAIDLDDLERRAFTFYAGLYLKLWSTSAVGQVMAKVPSLMIWDDHDIFDGWGSLPPHITQRPSIQAIYRAARAAFCLFQRGEAPKEIGQPNHDFSVSYRIEDLEIVVPDWRTYRTPTQVMAPFQWQWLEQLLAKTSAKHLLVVATVPLGHVDLAFMEKWVALLGLGYLDDLKDQWQALDHKTEWRRLMNLLREFAQTKNTRVEIVSGEIHLGASGQFIDNGQVFARQIVASGIAHDPPPQLMVSFLNYLAGQVITVDGSLSYQFSQLTQPFNKFLNRRNFLKASFEPSSGIKAQWVVDGLEQTIEVP